MKCGQPFTIQRFWIWSGWPIDGRSVSTRNDKKADQQSNGSTHAYRTPTPLKCSRSSNELVFDGRKPIQNAVVLVKPTGLNGDSFSSPGLKHGSLLRQIQQRFLQVLVIPVMAAG